ncbi:hypothetical protein BS47DRAFT_1362025 [Hydnum rufescens UP504]|uniref:Uncharacterized protein n=1 Tax=Hydnum rufescens UP504 TaxID=1448309 RepID=A0A9P6B0F0_9AGAM|nr:hypothetical protein BS47DRAFT_1362025 [Hydnum rufescens UP504]
MAFHKCGINPLDPGVFSEADFGPSQATSTIASSHLPPGFPIGWEESESSASKDTESDDEQNSNHDGPTGSPMLPPLHNHQAISSLAITPMDPAPISQHISTKLSKAELVWIACDLQDHNNEMQATIEKTCMYAAIIGQDYTQLQNQRAEEVSKAQEKEWERHNKAEKVEEACIAKAKKQYWRWVAAAVKIVNDHITQEEKAHQAKAAKEEKAHLA